MQDKALLPLPGMPVPLDAVCGAPGCGKKLRVDNGTGFCSPHKYAVSRTAPRFCAEEECGRQLHIKNKSGICPVHTAVKVNAEKRAATAEGRSEWRMCAAGGCEKRIGPGNKSGRCFGHRYSPVLPSERGACPINGCGRRLSPRNATGRCIEHIDPRWVAAVCAADGCAKTLNVTNLTGFCGQHTNGYRRDARLRRDYGISEADYAEMLAAQNGACALCGKPPKEGGKGAASALHVDHDHETGSVRALLCTNCNIGLGHFGHDAALMRAAAEYVEAYAALRSSGTGTRPAAA